MVYIPQPLLPSRARQVGTGDRHANPILVDLRCYPVQHWASRISDARIAPWIERLGLTYQLGVDGLSMPLMLMNSLLTWIAIYSSDPQISRPRLYYILVLVLGGAVAGAFLAQNLLLFFLFYEVELIPLYLIIAIWGGSRRGYAATKFLIYTAFSGVVILAAFFGLSFLSGSSSFDYEVLRAAVQIPQAVASSAA